MVMNTHLHTQFDKLIDTLIQSLNAIDTRIYIYQAEESFHSISFSVLINFLTFLF